MSKILGNRIRYYRNKSDLRQQELADKLCINRTYLSKLENGFHNPSSELMIKICEVFKCDLGDLFTIAKEENNLK